MSINTVYDMPYDELLGWFDYFERRPEGWRADDRASKLLQAQGVKEKPYKLFASLDAIYNPKSAKKAEGTLDVNSLKRSSLFQKMMSATGGAVIPL